MNNHWITVKGKVVEGHKVASQPSKEYPEYGTIEKQKPMFKKLGLNLDDYYNGTLNIDISPNTFEIIKPKYIFENVRWTNLHEPETFSFSSCIIRFDNFKYDGWVYYPHPETKYGSHEQPSSVIEVLAPRILGINYGNIVELELNNDEISTKEH